MTRLQIVKDFNSILNRFKLISFLHVKGQYRSSFTEFKSVSCQSRGGGGGGRPSSGIRPPADPKGPPFDTFSEIHFWPTDPKIFLKAPLAPIYTNFEGERAPKKNAIFFVKIFQKVPKNGFIDRFFKNLPVAQKILPK